MHANAVGLHHGSLSVAVYHQSRQAVSLAMNKSVGVVLIVVGNSDCQSHLQSLREALFPEVLVDGALLKRQHSHGNTSYLVVAYGYEFIFRRVHVYRVAVFYTFVHLCYGTRENPRVEAFQAFFFPSFQINRLVLSHTIIEFYIILFLC